MICHVIFIHCILLRSYVNIYVYVCGQEVMDKGKSVANTQTINESREGQWVDYMTLRREVEEMDCWHIRKHESLYAFKERIVVLCNKAFMTHKVSTEELEYLDALTRYSPNPIIEVKEPTGIETTHGHPKPFVPQIDQINIVPPESNNGEFETPLREEEEERAPTPVIYETEPERGIEGVMDQQEGEQEGATASGMGFRNAKHEQEPELVLSSLTGLRDDYYNKFVIGEPPTPELIILSDLEEEEYEPMDTVEEEDLEKDPEEDP